ncbi:MAG: twin-arginine translocase TatA/TatE family subunit [Actinomycetota bacterium]
MFFNVGGAEILVIAVIALLAIGPEQLPGVMRKIGGFVSQARSVTTGLRDEFMSGMDGLSEVTDLAKPESWMGSGSEDDPIVPRGYAGRSSAAPGNRTGTSTGTPADDVDTDADPAPSTNGDNGAVDGAAANGSTSPSDDAEVDDGEAR